MVLMKTAIINAKTGELEYKDIEGTIPVIVETKTDQEKLITYAKAQGWI